MINLSLFYITYGGNVPLILQQVVECGGVLHDERRDREEGKQEHVHHVQTLP